MVERFGKFVSVRQSGLQIKIPIIDSVAGRLSLRIQQLDDVVETKTSTGTRPCMSKQAKAKANPVAAVPYCTPAFTHATHSTPV